MNKVAVFETELLNLIGLECWGVVGGSGTGSVIQIDVGEKVLRERPLKNKTVSEVVRLYNSKIGFRIECPWRIENEKEVFCASHHSNEEDGPYEYGFNKIRGQIITGVELTKPAYDLCIKFANNASIRVHCSLIGMDQLECYSFKTILGWFTVGYDGTLKIEK